MKDIKVLGIGCTNCTKLAETLVQKAKELGVEAKVEKITDMQQIAQYGVMSVPAVVIDGAVKHAGSLPDDQKIEAWLKGASGTEGQESSGCCCCCGER